MTAQSTFALIRDMRANGFSWDEIEEAVLEAEAYYNSPEYEADLAERDEIHSMEFRSVHGDYWINEAGEYCLG